MSNGNSKPTLFGALGSFSRTEKPADRASEMPSANAAEKAAVRAADKVLPFNPERTVWSAERTMWGNQLRAQESVIETFGEVPPFTGILTAGAQATMRLPQDLEGLMAAIELGPKRAAILYCPDAAQKLPGMRDALSTLRTKLMAAGFSFPKEGDYPTRVDVLRLLYADHHAKFGSQVGGDSRVASNARRRFMNWLEIAVRERATDIHAQVAQGRTVVQIRVDGELEPLRDQRDGIYTESEGLESIAWPFNSAASKGSNSSAQWDATRNLYCMTEPRTVGDSRVVLRYQSLKGYLGPKMIARLLQVDLQKPTLTYDQLGYAPSQIDLMKDVTALPSGFVLFAGVTGSGKTTTLKTFVETHPGQGSMAIYSIEDPVEYPLKGVHQIVLQRDLTDVNSSTRQYNETVASLMRSDPDVVIVGEIRDMASARAGQQIVETGHMALGTVHAHLMSGIIPRLTNDEIGMSRDGLTHPNTLSALVYQALVPKLCPHCSLNLDDALEQARGPSDDIIQIGDGPVLKPQGEDEEYQLRSTVRALDERFKVSTSGLKFRRYSGCSHCNRRGTRGVTVVAEMMMPDRRWLELTREGRDYEALIHYRQTSDGRFDTPDMTGKTVLEHTLYKALGGLVDVRHCQRFDSLKRFDVAPGRGASPAGGARVMPLSGGSAAAGHGVAASGIANHAANPAQESKTW